MGKTFQSLEVGMHLGSYHLQKVLGAGGMGKVYLAEDRGLSRKVAIKVLNENFLEDEEAVTRFRNEGTALARLNHPNIVSVYSVGEELGHHYIAMEFLSGQELKNILKQRGLLSVDVALSVFLQIARGIEFAHGEGILHRDLKPANIVVTEDFAVKIVDFGIAKILDTTNGQTASGSLFGTLDYLPPERLEGAAPSPSGDIYSAGVLFFECLCGSNPFIANDVAAAMKSIRQTELQFSGPQAAKIPYLLKQTLLKMTAKDPEQRPKSMKEVIEVFEKIRLQGSVENHQTDDTVDVSQNTASDTTQILETSSVTQGLISKSKTKFWQWMYRPRQAVHAKVNLLNLKSKISFAILFVIILIQGVSFLLIKNHNSSLLKSVAKEELEASKRSLYTILRMRSQQLLAISKSVTNDFAFKEAFGRSDKVTLLSMLENHQLRAGSDFMALHDIDGKLIAKTEDSPQLQSSQSLNLLFEKALESSEESQKAILTIDNKAFQAVLVPLKAPLPIAWVVLGFEIDNHLAKTIKKATGTEVSFYSQSEPGKPVSSSILSSRSISVVDSSDADYPVKGIGDEQFLQAKITVHTAGDSVDIFMYRSLATIGKAVNHLELLLFILFFVSLAAAAVITYFVSGAISQPIQYLKEQTRRIQDGQLDRQIVTTGEGEVGKLALAINDIAANLRKQIDETATAYRELEKKTFKVHSVNAELEEKLNETSFMINLLKSMSSGRNPIETIQLAVDSFLMNFPFLKVSVYFTQDDREWRFVCGRENQVEGITDAQDLLLDSDFHNLVAGVFAGESENSAKASEFYPLDTDKGEFIVFPSRVCGHLSGFLVIESVPGKNIGRNETEILHSMSGVLATLCQYVSKESRSHQKAS